ncbi:MAG: hypothetical protein NTY38_15725 [Acidobacteria bacterium]|nr:hypothetical protein [Acidobacteriota bacterium]
MLAQVTVASQVPAGQRVFEGDTETRKVTGDSEGVDGDIEALVGIQHDFEVRATDVADALQSRAVGILEGALHLQAGEALVAGGGGDAGDVAGRAAAGPIADLDAIAQGAAEQKRHGDVQELADQVVDGDFEAIILTAAWEGQGLQVQRQWVQTEKGAGVALDHGLRHGPVGLAQAAGTIGGPDAVEEFRFVGEEAALPVELVATVFHAGAVNGARLHGNHQGEGLDSVNSHRYSARPRRSPFGSAPARSGGRSQG